MRSWARAMMASALCACSGQPSSPNADGSVSSTAAPPAGQEPPSPPAPPTNSSPPTKAGSGKIHFAGNGTGEVFDPQGGVLCTSDCQVGAFSQPTRLHLTAQAFAGSAFAGWQGDCSGTGTCELGTDRSFDVTATFVRAATMTLVFRGEGSGHVVSTPKAIDCPARCSADVVPGAEFTLQATPDEGSRFVSWRGACEGTDTCAVVAVSETSVQVEFSSSAPPPPPVASDAPQCAGLAPTQVERQQFIQPPIAGGCGYGYGDANGTLFFNSTLGSANAHAGFIASLRNSGTFLRTVGAGDGGLPLQQPAGLIQFADSYMNSNFFRLAVWDTNANVLVSHVGLDVRTNPPIPLEAFMAPNPNGGAVVAGDLSLDASAMAGHVVVMFGNAPPFVRWGPSPLASTGAVQSVGADVLGRSLVITDATATFGAGTLSGQWFESDGSSSTGEFSLGPSGFTSDEHWLETSPLIGGGLLIQSFEFKQPSDGTRIIRALAVVPSGVSHAERVPDWIATRSGARFAIARGGRAYAVLPRMAPRVPCTQQVDVLNRDGTWCGSQEFPIATGSCDLADLTLGADGTVMQSLPYSMETQTYLGTSSCTWRWWAGALR